VLRNSVTQMLMNGNRISIIQMSSNGLTEHDIELILTQILHYYWWIANMAIEI